MQRFQLSRRLRGDVELDLCLACEGIWFDQFESAQLAPSAVVALLRLMTQARPRGAAARLGERLICPHCADPLVKSMDWSKNGPFSYHRCPRWHGRYSGFASFLQEKGLVRHLDRRERQTLSVQVGVYQCPNCGAPVDVQHDIACAYCGSAVAWRDVAGLAKALDAKDAPPAPEITPVDG